MGLFMIKMGHEVIHVSAPSSDAAYEQLMITEDRDQMPCVELYDPAITPEQKQYNKLMLQLHDPEEYELRRQICEYVGIQEQRHDLQKQILEYQVTGRPVPQELRDQLAALPPPYSGPGWSPGRGLMFPHKPDQD